jgi:hypothetical protein
MIQTREPPVFTRLELKTMSKTTNLNYLVNNIQNKKWKNP